MGTSFQPARAGQANSDVTYSCSRPHVLDRAQVEPAVGGPVLGYIGEPQLIGRICCEVAPDKIVVHRWLDYAVLAALLSERAPRLVFRAGPLGGALGHRLTGIAGL
jgi:hypothetical protein